MKQRLRLLDALRGLTLISMIAYHALYNLNHHYGHTMKWYLSTPGYVWQQSICWTFIFLSGFCMELGRGIHSSRDEASGFGRYLLRKYGRGLLLTLCGLTVTAATALVMPGSIVIMGVLSFYGLAFLITVLGKPALDRIPSSLGFAAGTLLFFLTRDVNLGWLGFEGLRFCRLPDALYQGNLMMILGFPYRGFFSTDYFSILPWIFLFWSGLFLWRLLNQSSRLPRTFLQTHGCRPLEWIGRHSLLIYMLHQPVLVGVFGLLAMLGVL